MKIPSGYKIRILDSNGNDLTTADLILEEDFSIQISTVYEPLLKSGGSPNLTAFTSAITLLREKGFSGQFKQQGAQVWTETKPLELKLALSLYFKTSGKRDVYDPTIAIMKKSVPQISDNKFGLIPPGPNIFEILGVDPKDTALGNIFSTTDESVTIQVGEIIYLKKCVIKNAIPTYSMHKDTDGYPMKCKLDLDITTVDIVTKDMLDDLPNEKDNT